MTIITKPQSFSCVVIALLFFFCGQLAAAEARTKLSVLFFLVDDGGFEIGHDILYKESSPAEGHGIFYNGCPGIGHNVLYDGYTVVGAPAV